MFERTIKETAQLVVGSSIVGTQEVDTVVQYRILGVQVRPDGTGVYQYEGTLPDGSIRDRGEKPLPDTGILGLLLLQADDHLQSVV